jgi:DNA-binding response OmpR family regulator
MGTQVSEQELLRMGNALGEVRVLFAEDEDGLMGLFRSIIDDLGWKALYVSNALEMMTAVNHLISEGLTLDGVVADISFLSGPKLTGITAVREIRKVFPNVPVIFISVYVTSIIREEVRRVGGEIIQKPFDLDELFIRLIQLIHWNRVVSAQEYKGQERRRNSVNRTHHERRATDYILSTPDRIAKTLIDARRKQYEGSKELHRRDDR